MHAIVLAAILVAAPSWGSRSPGAAQEPPAAVRIVQVDSIAGLRAQADQSADFLAGFREGFESERLAAETRGFDAWKPGAELVNRFRADEGAPSREAWRLGVEVRLPQLLTGAWEPGYWYWEDAEAGVWIPGFGSGRVGSRLRVRRAMTLLIFVTDPDRRWTEPVPIQSGLVFPLGPMANGESAGLNRAVDFPWREAGRTAALLALEALHHRSGDLGANARLALEPALRSEAQRPPGP